MSRKKQVYYFVLDAPNNEGLPTVITLDDTLQPLQEAEPRQNNCKSGRPQKAKKTKRKLCIWLFLLVILNGIVVFSLLLAKPWNSSNKGITKTSSNQPDHSLLKFKSNDCKSINCHRSTLASRLMDVTADPCVDFYKYACGNFKKVVKEYGYSIDSSSVIDWTTIVSKQVKNSLADVLSKESPQFVESQAKRKVKKVFNACTNNNNWSENRQAVKKIAKDTGGFMLKNYAYYFDVPRLDDTLAKSFQFTLSSLFKLQVTQNKTNSSLYAVLKISPPSADYNYLSYYSMIELVKKVESSFSVDRSKVRQMADFHKDLDQVISSSSFFSGIRKTKITVGELNKNYGMINWTAVLTNGLHLPINDSTTLVLDVATKSYLSALNGLLLKHSRTLSKRMAIHNYIVYKSIQQSYHDHAFTPDQCVSIVASLLPFATGSIFENTLDMTSIQDKVTTMLELMLKAYKTSIDFSTLFSDQYKQKVADLISSFTYQLGLPAWTKSPQLLDNFYEGFYATDSSVQNIVNMYQFQLRNAMETIGAPVKDVDLNTLILQVNALVIPDLHKMKVLTGIMLPPYFEQTYADVFNYGGLGFVLGHEIGHMYSTLNESEFKNDLHLKERKLCMSKAHKEHSFDNIAKRSSLTVDDDIADVIGTKIAYLVFKESLGRQTEEDSKYFSGWQLSPDQLFFLSFAQVNCFDANEATWKNIFLKSDHSHGPYRVNGTLSLIPEFSEAFNCPLASPMNPINKCAMW